MLNYLIYSTMLRGESKLNMTKFWTFGSLCTHILPEAPNTRTESTSELDSIWARIHKKNLNYGIANEKEHTCKWLNFTFGSSSMQDQQVNQ